MTCDGCDLLFRHEHFVCLEICNSAYISALKEKLLGKVCKLHFRPSGPPLEKY